MVWTLADDSGVMVLGVLSILAVVGAAVAGWVMYAREQKRRVAAEQRVSAHTGSGQQWAHERDQVMFNQHRRMNELATAKLEAEVALLQGQVKARAGDDDRLHASKEFHELSVEKTKLEIDSLRLHIAEQRKRIDDWGLGGG